MLRFDVRRDDKRWLPYQPLFRTTILNLCQKAWELVEHPLRARVSVLLSNDATIQPLNAQFRGKDKPTNVLSFPSLSDMPHPRQVFSYGDIIMAYETIERESIEQAKPLDHHITHMALHGFLHLLGFDHEQEEERLIMEAHEIQLLSQTDIPNPYEV